MNSKKEELCCKLSHLPAQTFKTQASMLIGLYQDSHILQELRQVLLLSCMEYGLIIDKTQR
jgi:hypothetical protein